MVQQSAMPITIWRIAVSIPTKITQKIFIIRLAGLALQIISFPKGARESFAILKHCMARGKPIIVIDNTIP